MLPRPHWYGAIVEYQDNTTEAFGLFDPQFLSLSSEWGQISNQNNSFVVSGLINNHPINNNLQIIDQNYVDQFKPVNTYRLPYSFELNGGINQLRTSFWNLLEINSTQLRNLLQNGNPISISYYDRYVKSPLHARILYEILYRFRGKEINLNIVTQNNPQYGTFRNQKSKFWDDWSNDHTRKAVIDGLFQGSFNFPNGIHFQNLNHFRYLEIQWANNQIITINIDEGLGNYELYPRPRVNYDFDSTVAAQIQSITNATFSISNRNAESLIYINHRIFTVIR
jgi:hypothetical protein